MKVLFYSTKSYELPYIKAHVPEHFQVGFGKEALSVNTVRQAQGYDAVCIFTPDDAGAGVLKALTNLGIQKIAVRAAGYDNVDIQAANEVNIRVANVPEYSPNSVAEHAVAMMLALNRKLIRANEQVHRQNFTLDHLIGFDLNKKKVGIVGTGRIGRVVARILHGFGCALLAYDVNVDQSLERDFNVFYTDLHTLCSSCDIITLHLPLTQQTRYLIDKKYIEEMKRGIMLINTSRGAVVNTRDVIDALPSGHIGYYGMDVYEFEKGIFFEDHEGAHLDDNMLMTLMDYSNVLITPHQAFATQEALANIAATTFQNLLYWSRNEPSKNEITYTGPPFSSTCHTKTCAV